MELLGECSWLLGWQPLELPNVPYYVKSELPSTHLSFGDSMDFSKSRLVSLSIHEHKEKTSGSSDHAAPKATSIATEGLASITAETDSPH